MKHFLKFTTAMTILFSAFTAAAAQTWSCTDATQNWGVFHTVQVKEDADGSYSLYVGKRVNNVMGLPDMTIAPTLVDSNLECVFSKEKANVFRCSKSTYISNRNEESGIYTVASSNNFIERNGKLTQADVLNIYIYLASEDPASEKLKKIVGEDRLDLTVLQLNPKSCGLK